MTRLAKAKPDRPGNEYNHSFNDRTFEYENRKGAVCI